MKKTERKVFWHDVYTQPKSRSLKSPKTLEIKTAFEIIKKLNKEDMFVESKDKQEYYYVSD